MHQTLKVINDMQQGGLFKAYAIGGGIAALYYIEPILTYDKEFLHKSVGYRQPVGFFCPQLKRRMKTCPR
jgi:hypothetical protein